jgi:hypothetical protein
MTTNLFCLVDGQTTSNAFPVEIESTKTIGHLKELIKTKKDPEFDNIAADKLIIWKVSIPGDNSGSAIEIGSLVDKILHNKPRDSVSTLISEKDDDNTYILVELPPGNVNIH